MASLFHYSWSPLHSCTAKTSGEISGDARRLLGRSNPWISSIINDPSPRSFFSFFHAISYISLPFMILSIAILHLLNFKTLWKSGIFKRLILAGFTFWFHLLPQVCICIICSVLLFWGLRRFWNQKLFILQKHERWISFSSSKRRSRDFVGHRMHLLCLAILGYEEFNWKSFVCDTDLSKTKSFLKWWRTTLFGSCHFLSFFLIILVTHVLCFVIARPKVSIF